VEAPFQYQSNFNSANLTEIRFHCKMQKVVQRCITVDLSPLMQKSPLC